MDSSRGSHRSFGRSHLMIFLHIGRRISAPSKESTSPAPLEIHTEYDREFSRANLGSVAWIYLSR